MTFFKKSSQPTQQNAPSKTDSGLDGSPSESLFAFISFRSKKSSVAIVVIVALLLQVISAIQYWFAREGIRDEVQHRAQTELNVKNLEIQKVMVAVETAVNNTVWAAERLLPTPDSLYIVLRRLVLQNSTIVGAGLLFQANYYPQKGRWFEPYVLLQPNGVLEESQIGGPTHDYLQAEFFQNGIQADSGYWSEPYFDNAGAKMMLCTYTQPIHDSSGRIVALVGADVSLDWLSSVINASHIYPSSYNVILSRTGQIMACPVESLVMQRTIQDITADARDTNIHHINNQMMRGHSGQAAVRDNDGNKNYVFYAPVQGNTGWSMAVVCTDREIYRGLRQVSFNLFLLMLLGMALLAFIIYRVARNARSLHKAHAAKQRIDSELRIARGIQESMVPKTFPPFPQRQDLDIFAALTPAKEIGGDLYDYFIRDEKLFFCIGDVSGKGVPAALVMAVTRSLFRSVSAHNEHPADIVAAINDSMAEMNESDMFVTLFVAVLNLSNGHMHYCNAGHEAPLLIGRGIGLLPTENNIPVGLMVGWNYVGLETDVYSLTTIFLYTDGLSEAENSEHVQFTKQRLVEVARQTLAHHSQANPEASFPEKLVTDMTAALHQFVGEAEQSDDLTMLAIRFCPTGSCS